MIDVPCSDIAVRRDNGRVVVDVRGEVDVTGAATLGDVLRDLAAEGVHDLVLDLSAVTFLDSTGLSVLVAARNRCRAQEGEVTLCEPSPAAWKVLAIAGLDRLFPVEPAI